jgi:hypothetical protein
MAEQWPKKAQAYTFYLGLLTQADTRLLKANPTLAAGDVKVSKDGGAFANLTTLPDAYPAAGRAVRVQLSAPEMTADNVVVVFTDAAGAEWCDALVSITTTTTTFSAQAGSGALAFTFTQYEANGTTPLPGVAVWVTTDSAGANVVAGVVVTDVNGQAIFRLDPATYYLWRQIAGWTFTNPETIVVS